MTGTRRRLGRAGRRTGPAAPAGFPRRARRLLQGTALLLSLWMPTAAIQAQSFEFAEPVLENAGLTGQARAAGVGDVNRDGLDDIVASEGFDRVVVRLQDAQGRLQAPQVLTPAVSWLFALRVADIDRDGHGELLVGHASGLALYAHGKPWRYLAASGENACRVMDVADLEGDGWLDVVCMGDGGHVSIFANDRAGALRAARTMLSPAVGWTSPQPTAMQIRLRDVTGDGRTDLVAVGGGTSGFYVHPGDGAGGFLPAHGYPHTTDRDSTLGASGVAVIDVDGDGTVEIVTSAGCNSPCARLNVHRRDAQGYYRHVAPLDLATFDLPTGLLTHDLDGDGRLDLVVPHTAWSAVGRYMGGASGLARGERLSNVTVNSIDDNAAALGDVNGDGCSDLVVASALGLGVLHGRCLHDAPGDFTGDGVPDIFWRNASTGQNVIWRSADASRPLAVASVADTRWHAAAQGDFDGDGTSDVLWRHGATGANAIWRSGNATTSQSIAALATDWSLAGAGDFDGDGREDLLWRQAGSGRNVVWHGGSERTTGELVRLTDLRWQVAGIADFDGDGRADVLWRHSVTGQNAIWRSGQHAQPQGVVGVTDLRWRVAGLGDFDGDGRADILWRHAASGANAVWRGANHASQQPMVAVTNLDWRVYGIADFDGDRRDDILWRNPKTGANVIWRSGQYATQTGLAPLAGQDWTTPGR